MNKESFKKRGAGLGIVIGVIVVAFILMIQFSPRLVKDDQGFSHIVWDGNFVRAQENTTIGSTASGCLEIFFINHTASPSTAYDDNVSSHFESWCNASLDPDNAGTAYRAYTRFNGFSNVTIKWGVAFDIVVRYRGNATNAKNSTIFNANNCRVKINTTGGGVTISALTLTNVVSKNSSSNTFIWINAYANNGGSGYTLNKGATCTVTNIKIEFNY